MVDNEDIKKICSFYVSDWHFVTMLLPHINKKIDDKVKIATILENEEKTYMTTLLGKLQLLNKEKILKINWNRSIINTDEFKKILQCEENEIEIIIKGKIDYINEVNKKLEELLENTNKKVTIVNCYNVDENKQNIIKILNTYNEVLNTSGIKTTKEYLAKNVANN